MTQPQQPAPALTPSMPLVTVMAVACGLAVANIYYAQPLLDLLTRQFGIGSGTASLIVTVTQIGYAAGLVFLVPLGDQVNRRRLITWTAAGTGAALAAAMISPGFGWFVAASFFIGVTATCAQIMVPMAAHLAEDGQRGAVVGRVMSGLLIGILLARAFSGIVADIAGWRAVFGIGALTMFVLAAVLYRALPEEASAAARMSYPQTLRSVAALLRDEPTLRRRIVYGGCGFAGFTIVWTALPFLLARAPYHYGETAIGLFSLLGAAGALGANAAGRLHDAGYGRRAVAGFMLAAIASFAGMGLFSTHVVAIVLGLFFMDLGVQGVQILNQSTIYALRPEARSRITTAYIGCFFIAGAIGSALAGVSFELAGWPGTMAVAGLLEAAALLFWATER
ncbi:MFS transporter [Salinisphaera hydrothermalis]|uniref:MFS transporter n=1 Tax=Salinisphaera hydrothermalis TaxID=563188 RepID=UPI0033411161